MDAEFQNKLKEEVERLYKQDLTDAKKRRIKGYDAIRTICGDSCHYRRGTVMSRIRKALKLVPDIFSIGDIIGAVVLDSGEACNYGTVGACMSRLKKDGIIIAAHERRGRIPCKYRLASPRKGE